MIGALLALNRHGEQQQNQRLQQDLAENEKEEEQKIEALPTGESSNVGNTLSLSKEEGEGADGAKKEAFIDDLKKKRAG